MQPPPRQQNFAAPAQSASQNQGFNNFQVPERNNRPPAASSTSIDDAFKDGWDN
jgi:hypothetical protein